MSSVTLYHGMASTCSKKVRLSLYEKGVAFESRLLDLQKFEQHDPAYLAINPNGVVPALVHDGRSVIESSIIAEYVDEAFEGPTLSPADPVARARMRLWLRFSDEAAYPAIAAPTWQYMRHRAAKALEDQAILARVPTAERRERWNKMAKGGYSDEEIEAAVVRMGACLDKLEAQLAETEWLAGDAFSLADIAVLPFAVRIRNLKPELMTRPAVNRWLERAAERPSFARALEFSEDPRAAELPNI
ncbi:glutathione S-transferase family protein [Sphingomonas sp. AOB5]|uniref:glutathione S-transferase family protein n=1 Tax=Sphingomonas sp. AOB5 TaxID=3034017 RepID=UPI0023F737DE|nr:glutathione S-transferase family protein [Sphingomonas sp. AOB5]MDF7776462.1 glutathione S-transferase family protein [Sphingomonas sp. AOB5]